MALEDVSVLLHMAGEQNRIPLPLPFAAQVAACRCRVEGGSKDVGLGLCNGGFSPMGLVTADPAPCC